MLVVGPSQVGAHEGRPLRVGIVNIMPRVESYEPMLLRPLARAAPLVEVTWIRLESHKYGSSDTSHIARSYVTFEQATSVEALDGVILTGAPVEEIPYGEVHYWVELCEVLRECLRARMRVLGICWGGLALARQLGIEKVLLGKKVFGVFENEVLEAEHPVLGGSDDVFRCAHSRHSGIPDTELEEAREAGIVRLLAHGAETGYSVFESPDGALLMHLGHPEYEADRIVHEWARDHALGRPDVEAPRNFDLDRPRNLWRAHRNELFGRWLHMLALARMPAATKLPAPMVRESACASR
jgi:homoserine O-succinyltransferase